MDELTKQERLEKEVKDAKDAKAAFDAAYFDAKAAAWTAHLKALQELEDYLEEQQDNA